MQSEKCRTTSQQQWFPTWEYTDQFLKYTRTVCRLAKSCSRRGKRFARERGSEEARRGGDAKIYLR